MIQTNRFLEGCKCNQCARLLPKNILSYNGVLYVLSIVGCSDDRFIILLCTYCWLSYLPTAHITCKCSRTSHSHAICLQLPQMVSEDFFMCFENVENLEMHCAIFRTTQHHFNWDNFTLITNRPLEQAAQQFYCTRPLSNFKGALILLSELKGQYNITFFYKNKTS